MTKLRAGVAALAILIGIHGAAFADGPSTSVEVTGQVARPTTFTPTDLAALATHDVTIASDNASPRRYHGVLLRDLVAACMPIERGHFDLRQSYFVARATDGYLAIFSWAELFNSAVGDEVLVAYEVDGMPLSDAEGRVSLVSGRDIRTGPRHVRWLTAVDMRRAQP